jgi:uncharacterized repeat protein (TIGR03803 family)
MSENIFGRSLCVALALAAALLIASPKISAQVNVIYDFGTYPSDAATPYTTFLVADPVGNLYGTTTETLSAVYGSVFELSPQPPGWSEKLLHTFDGVDGWNADTSSGLVRDSAGNLYGMTAVGGSYGPYPQDGVVYELSPSGNSWKYSIIWEFGKVPQDGINPTGSFIIDKNGQLYGVTSLGGSNGYGTVFKLHYSNGVWSEQILFNFNQTDGENPNGPLVMDAKGDLFGTTYNGGNSFGTAFELKLTPAGSYQLILLCNFHGYPDGANPDGSLLALAGSLFGTTSNGGTHNNGTIFQLTPQGAGWKKTVIDNFGQGLHDGAHPRAGLTAANGGIYGTTEYGGSTSAGTVFGLHLQGGVWGENFLASFLDEAGQATYPSGGLLLYSDGNLYGTAAGGTEGVGTVYNIAP